MPDLHKSSFVMSAKTRASRLWHRPALAITRALTSATFCTHDVPMKRLVTVNRRTTTNETNIICDIMFNSHYWNVLLTYYTHLCFNARYPHISIFFLLLFWNTTPGISSIHFLDILSHLWIFSQVPCTNLFFGFRSFYAAEQNISSCLHLFFRCIQLSWWHLNTHLFQAAFNTP